MSAKSRSPTPRISPSPSRSRRSPPRPTSAPSSCPPAKRPSRRVHGGICRRLMQKPTILSENESISILLRVQPLQTGYHTIPLRLQNETDLTESTELSIVTVGMRALCDPAHHQSHQAGRRVPLAGAGLSAHRRRRHRRFRRLLRGRFLAPGALSDQRFGVRFGRADDFRSRRRGPRGRDDSPVDRLPGQPVARPRGTGGGAAGIGADAGCVLVGDVALGRGWDAGA